MTAHEGNGDAGERFERAYGCSAQQALNWLLNAAVEKTKGDRHAAEDLAQETFLALLARPPKTVPVIPRAYLRRALTNQFIDQLRKTMADRRGADHLSRPLEDSPEPLAPGPGPEGLALLEQTRTTMREALGRLPERERAVVRLALDCVSLGLDHRSREEIARELGIPVGTVKSRLHSAIGHLQELIPRPGKGGNG